MLLFSLSLFGESVQNIKTPKGYERIKTDVGSYSDWVRNLNLKKDKKIKTYDGSYLSPTSYDSFGVIDIPLLFKQDLEQCADYSMRLWAEYHKEKKILGKLYLFDYNGNRKLFKSSGKSYKSFLKWAMAYSNSHSLKKGTQKIDKKELIPGDMVVQNEGGGIGHVSVIVDVCKNAKEETLYLIGYSFMPAQEFHIEKASEKYGKEGWFSIEGYYKYLKENLDLGQPVLRRFEAK